MTEALVARIKVDDYGEAIRNSLKMKILPINATKLWFLWFLQYAPGAFGSPDLARQTLTDYVRAAIPKGLEPEVLTPETLQPFNPASSYEVEGIKTLCFGVMGCHRQSCQTTPYTSSS